MYYKINLLLVPLNQLIKIKLTLDYQLNVKLKEHSLNIKLLNTSKEKEPLYLALWEGKKPVIKPKIMTQLKFWKTLPSQQEPLHC